MNATLQRAFEMMLEASFSATILALIITAVQWVLRGRLSPAWRFALWTPVLLRLFLPIFPESAFSLFNAPRWYASWTGAAERPTSKSTFVETREPAGFDNSMVHDWSDVPETASLPPAATLPAAVLTGERIRSIAAILWTFGVFLFLSRLAIGTAWLSWRTRTAVSPAHARLSELLHEAARTIACASRPRLKETNLVESPALFGLWRPVLLLPSGFSERLSETEIRHVFLHELAHLKRRDLLLNWLMALAQSVHWFNPVAWLVFRRMRLERELACDEMAVRAGSESDPKAYGETILRLLEGVSSRPALSALVGIAEEKHSAKQRLQQIAAFRAGKRKYWIAVPVLIGLVLVGLTNAQAPKKAEEAAQESNERKPLEDETSERSNFHKDETLIRFDVLQLEGKTLTEALQILRAEFPGDLKDVRFNWYQTTNITSSPDGTYSANAIGYITTEIGKRATPADELLVSRQALSKDPNSQVEMSPLVFEPNANLRKSGQVISALELILRAVEKRVLCRIQDDRMTFSLEATPEDRLFMLIQDGRLLLELNRIAEATQKLEEALVIDPDSRAARYYLDLAQARALSEEARDREAAVNIIHPTITNTGGGIISVFPNQERPLWDVFRHEPTDPSKQIGFDWYAGNVLLAKDKVSLSDADRTNDNVAATNPRLQSPIPGMINVTDYLVDSKSGLPGTPVEDHGTDATTDLPDDQPRFSNGLRYDRNPTQVEFRYSNKVTLPDKSAPGESRIANSSATAKPIDNETTNAIVQLTRLKRVLDALILEKAKNDERLKVIGGWSDDGLSQLDLARRQLNEMRLTLADKHWVVQQQKRLIERLESMPDGGGPANDTLLAQRLELQGKKSAIEKNIASLSNQIEELQKRLGSQSGKNVQVKEGDLVAQPNKTLEPLANAPTDRGPATAAALPPNPYARTNRVYANVRRQVIVKKLHEVVLPVYDVADLPLKEVIKDLSHTARQRDPDKAGVNFIFSSLGKAPEVSPPNTVRPLPKVDDFRITISPPLRNVRLIDVLDAITHVAVPPEGADPSLRLRYSIEDYAVVFSHGAEEPEPLYTRSFKVDPNTFVHGLDQVYFEQGAFRRTTGQGRGTQGGGILGVTITNSMSEIQEAVRDFFTAAGIDFPTNQFQFPTQGKPTPPQKAIFFNDRTGVLLVRATLREVDIVEKALQVLNMTPPQIMIRAEQVAIKDDADLKILVQALAKIQGNFRPVLTDLEFRQFKRETGKGDRFFVRLQHLTTLSGRPVRASLDEHAVDIIPIYYERNNSIRIEAKSSDLNRQQRAVTRRGTIYDGQTFVVLPSEAPESPRYITFITADLVDPAGNLVRSPDEQDNSNEKTPQQDEKY